jgi:hypothetical protein
MEMWNKVDFLIWGSFVWDLYGYGRLSRNKTNRFIVLKWGTFVELATKFKMENRNNEYRITFLWRVMLATVYRIY